MRRRLSPSDHDPSASAQLRAFIAKFDRTNGQLIRALRSAMRRRLPHAHELVYDNYNFLVIVWSPSERVSDAYFSFGADAHGVNLFFGYNGVTLPDPKGLLRGKGKLNRFLRLESAEHLASRDVAALVTAAVERSKVPIDETSTPQLVIKMISTKQRPRRLGAAAQKPRVTRPKGAARHVRLASRSK